MRLFLHISSLILFICIGCRDNTSTLAAQHITAVPPKPYDVSIPVIHVMVALCDNQYQGIVPVPAKIGNGQNPATNLYWNCQFGVKAFFKNSKQWQLVTQYKPSDSCILERIILKHTQSKFILVADAYNGSMIKKCTIDFLKSCSGQLKDTAYLNNKIIGIYGNAKMLAYIGHDGLMDFSIDEKFMPVDTMARKAIILACISKKYFAPHLQNTHTYPLVWSTGLMSPEAYTLHDAIAAYIIDNSPIQIQYAAAKAYAQYQHCSLNAAKRLLVTGY